MCARSSALILQALLCFSGRTLTQTLSGLKAAFLLALPAVMFARLLLSKLTNCSVSGESSIVEERDLRMNFTKEKWLSVLADCAKYLRGIIDHTPREIIQNETCQHV